MLPKSGNEVYIQRASFLLQPMFEGRWFEPRSGQLIQILRNWHRLLPWLAFTI